MYTAVLVVYLLVALALTVTVLGQSGRSAGLGAISGGAEQVFGKKKGLDELLHRVSTVLAALFILLSLVLAYMDKGSL